MLKAELVNAKSSTMMTNICHYLAWIMNHHCPLSTIINHPSISHLLTIILTTDWPSHEPFINHIYHQLIIIWTIIYHHGLYCYPKPTRWKPHGMLWSWLRRQCLYPGHVGMIVHSVGSRAGRSRSTVPQRLCSLGVGYPYTRCVTEWRVAPPTIPTDSWMFAEKCRAVHGETMSNLKFCVPDEFFGCLKSLKRHCGRNIMKHTTCGRPNSCKDEWNRPQIIIG